MAGEKSWKTTKYQEKGYKRSNSSIQKPKQKSTKSSKIEKKMRLAGFEPAAPGLGILCSIQLSYNRIRPVITFDSKRILKKVLYRKGLLHYKVKHS